jgi:hypothetical protein
MCIIHQIFSLERCNVEQRARARAIFYVTFSPRDCLQTEDRHGRTEREKGRGREPRNKSGYRKSRCFRETWGERRGLVGAVRLPACWNFLAKNKTSLRAIGRRDPRRGDSLGLDSPVAIGFRSLGSGPRFRRALVKSQIVRAIRKRLPPFLLRSPLRLPRG